MTSSFVGQYELITRYSTLGVDFIDWHLAGMVNDKYHKINLFLSTVGAFRWRKKTESTLSYVLNYWPKGLLDGQLFVLALPFFGGFVGNGAIIICCCSLVVFVDGSFFPFPFQGCGRYRDPREEHTSPGNEEGCIHLQYPPPAIYFKPEMQTNTVFKGIPKGIIPISPSMVRFRVDADGGKVNWREGN